MIVAKKLEQKSVPNQSQVLLNIKESASAVKNKKNIENLPSKSNLTANERFTQDSQEIIKFVKTNTKNSSRATVVKKQSNDSKDQKKSLSDIFSTGSSKADLNFSVSSLEIPSKNEINTYADSKMLTSTSSKQDKFNNEKLLEQKKDNQLKFDKKRIKYKEKNNKIGNKKLGDKNERVMRKPSGKISSLFGNNPEVPNIGQRFVKPVQEKVFSGNKFSDLEIHPYSVRIYLFRDLNILFTGHQ